MHLIEQKLWIKQEKQGASSSQAHTEMEADSKQQPYLSFVLLTLETQ